MNAARVSEDCMWCGQTGYLATFTSDGEVDESTPCVCVLRSVLDGRIPLDALAAALPAEESTA